MTAETLDQELFLSIVFYVKPDPAALHSEMSRDMMAVYNLKLRGKSQMTVYRRHVFHR